MKIITCASYYGVGSSAFTDLVAEYKNVKDLSNFEFRFIHDIDGVADLEYYLVENHNRHNSGHALKRFERLSTFNEGNFMSRRYSQFFENDDYHRITQDYIESLKDFEYKGWWFYDLYDKGAKKYYLYQIFNHLYHKTNLSCFRILKNEMTYCSHLTEEEFLKKTQEYISNLMKALNKEDLEYLEIDQIVPSSNIERVLRYFKDEIFVAAVDRDPRDIYFSWKYYWKDATPPGDGVEKFCSWYRYTREAGRGLPKNNDHILKIQFEDIIFHYNETIEVIEKFTKLNPHDHIRKFEKMNPKRSAVNTMVWKQHTTKQDISDLKYIESHLPDYLYDFESVNASMVVGVEVKDNKVF